MYTVYQIIITLVFVVFFPVLFIGGLLVKKYRQGLLQRFGWRLPDVAEKGGKKRIWMHASSVGEVQAAKALINQLDDLDQELEIFVSTMTTHGQDIAREQLPEGVTCFFSPLDVPFIVRRVVSNIAPDLYVCLETELWPSILRCLKKQDIPVVLLNGRMSVRSVVTYSYFRKFFKQVLANFDRMAFITTADMGRYVGLGADKTRCILGGNVKYDIPVPEDKESIKNKYLNMLNIPDGKLVFISGSTHTGEEEQLLKVFHQFKKDIVWITVPRHLERLNAIEKMFAENEIGYQKFSALKSGKKREESVILVDSMGELFHLYSIGDYIFCGGSLVERGGHNIMEAAIWDKAVFYGPSMNDYKDAVSLLEFAEAGFMVENVDQLIETINHFQINQDVYDTVCHRAGTIAQAQQGAARKQADIIVEVLHNL